MSYLHFLFRRFLYSFHSIKDLENEIRINKRTRDQKVLREIYERKVSKKFNMEVRKRKKGIVSKFLFWK